MSQVIDSLERAQLRQVPVFQAGDRVRVHFQVIEGTRRRVQVFEGTVIKRQGSGVRETFTVRKQSFGVGVERTFPVHSPKIEELEVASRGDVRRAKLYYLRGRVGRRARVRERQSGRVEAVAPALGEPVLADDAGSQFEAPLPVAEPETEECAPETDESAPDSEQSAPDSEQGAPDPATPVLAVTDTSDGGESEASAESSSEEAGTAESTSGKEEPRDNS